MLFGTRIDPLRAKNPDFEIVGPPWLSVVVFVALVLVHGMLVAALAGRYSRSLPLLSRRRRAIAGHLPLLLLAPAALGVVILAIVGILAVALSRLRPVLEVVRSHRFVLVGRIALGVIVLVALPSFITSISAILGSSA